MAHISTVGLSREAANGLARGLGWFSIVLGLTELIAPGSICKRLGMTKKEALIQAYGMREIVSGFGLLASSEKAPWAWSRAVGDVLDLAALRQGNSKANPRNGAAQMAMAAVAAIGV